MRNISDHFLSFPLVILDQFGILMIPRGQLGNSYEKIAHVLCSLNIKRFEGIGLNIFETSINKHNKALFLSHNANMHKIQTTD